MAVERKDWLCEDHGDCADKYFRLMLEHPQITEDNIRFLKRHFAASIQNDAQEGLLAFMSNDHSSGPINKKMIASFGNYPSLVDRASEILGQRHPAYKNLKSRSIFFRGFEHYHNLPFSVGLDQSRPTLDLFHESLSWDQNSPLTHYYLALTYLNNAGLIDSSIYHVRKAMSCAETWVLPLTHIAFYLVRHHKEYALAESLLGEALQVDENSALVWLSFATLYKSQGKHDLAEHALKRVIAIDITNCLNWANLAATIMRPSRMNEVSAIFQQSDEFCKGENAFWHYVRGCYYRINQLNDLALDDFTQASILNPRHAPTQDSLVSLYLHYRLFDKALIHATLLTSLLPKDESAHLSLAKIQCSMGLNKECLESVQKAIQLNPSKLSEIEREILFDLIKKEDEYKQLLHKN